MSVAVAVALPFVAAAALRRVRGWRYASLAVAAASFLLLLPELSLAMRGEPVSRAVAWVPSMGVEAGFFVDAFSGLFSLVILIVGAGIFLYSTRYMRGDRAEFRFHRLMLFFMGSMLGVALSGDLVTLFLFWELTSLSSFLLIGLYSEEAESIYSARKALLVTLSGGLALLAGFLLLGSVGGTYSIPGLMSSGSVRTSSAYPLIVGLVLVGAGSKAAQFPLHIWLPDAMVAPTPVSAYLHSAAMVKAGVFLIGRLTPVLGGTSLWEVVVPAVGLTTMVVAGVMAVRSDDLKRLLAYSTASHLGLITSMFGWGFTLGGVLHLVNHASFKSVLFMVAGVVMHETGSRSIREVGGLRRGLPVTAAVAGVASLSMAGVPPFGGFVSKELFFKAAVYEGGAWLAAAWLAGVLSFLYSLKFFAGTFLGEARGEVHGEPLGMVLPAAVLVVPTLVLGFGLGGGLVEEAAHAVGSLGGELGLWHGLSLELALSAATFLVGSVLLLRLERTEAVLNGVAGLAPVTPDGVFDAMYEGAPRRSVRFASLIDDAGLRRRLRVLAFLAAAGLVFSFLGGLPRIPGLEAEPAVVVVGSIIVASAAYVVFVESHVTGTVVLGLVGFSVALLYVFAGAPDLALTQILVETLGFVLLLLVIQRLPAFYSERTGARVGDAVLSAVVGGAVFFLAAAPPGDSRLSGFFLEKAVDVAGGHNVVNVILVDFRALDTLGEITVVAIAAVGALMLLRRGEE